MHAISFERAKLKVNFMRAAWAHSNCTILYNISRNAALCTMQFTSTVI